MSLPRAFWTRGEAVSATLARHARSCSSFSNSGLQLSHEQDAGQGIVEDEGTEQDPRHGGELAGGEIGLEGVLLALVGHAERPSVRKGVEGLVRAQRDAQPVKRGLVEAAACPRRVFKPPRVVAEAELPSRSRGAS